MANDISNGKKGEQPAIEAPATETHEKTAGQKGEALVGLLRKAVKLVCKASSFPILVYIGILVALPILFALIEGLEGVLYPRLGSVWVVFATLLAVICVAACLYACIGIIISVLRLMNKGRSFNEALYELVYAPSYASHMIGLIVICAAGGIGVALLGTWLEGLFVSNGSPVKSIIEFELAMPFAMVLMAKLFSMPLKFILTATRWCPYCGKFFALGFISDHTLLGAEEAAVAQYSENGRKYHVKGVREYHHKAWTCKYCGNQVSKTYAKEYV